MHHTLHRSRPCQFKMSTEQSLQTKAFNPNLADYNSWLLPVLTELEACKIVVGHTFDPTLQHSRLRITIDTIKNEQLPTVVYQFPVLRSSNYDVLQRITKILPHHSTIEGLDHKKNVIELKIRGPEIPDQFAEVYT